MKKEREKNGMEEKCMCVHQRCVEVVYGVVVEVGRIRVGVLEK